MSKKFTKSYKPTNTEKYSRGIDDMSQMLDLDNHINGKYVSKTKTQALKNCRKAKEERNDEYFD